MAETEYRTFTPDLEVRASGDGRTVHGIAVPYDREQRINARLTEVFVRGAFAHQLRASHRVPFTRDHMSHGGTLLGRARVLRDDAKGLYGEFRVAETAAGDEALALVRDGALDQLSIGFREGQNGRRPNGTIERRKAHLTEVALVMTGAYGDGAVVTGTRATEGDWCPACGHGDTGGSARLREAEQILAALPVLDLGAPAHR